MKIAEKFLALAFLLLTHIVSAQEVSELLKNKTWYSDEDSAGQSYMIFTDTEIISGMESINYEVREEYYFLNEKYFSGEFDQSKVGNTESTNFITTPSYKIEIKKVTSTQLVITVKVYKTKQMATQVFNTK